MAWLGVAVYFAYALARRRVVWRSLVGAAIAFALLLGLTLVILRLQLGKWFTTGYSLAPIFYGPGQLGFSLPGPSEVYISSAATGSYSQAARR